MSRELQILGVNAFHGDSSAALLAGGELQTAIEEERLRRVKHWAGLPALAIGHCLQSRDPGDIAHVAISRNPAAHLPQKLLRAALHPGAWARVLSRARNTARLRSFSADVKAAGHSLERARFHFVEHHRAHMASAFFASPFEEAAVISVDGFGDFSSIMWGVGRGNQIRVQGSTRFPHSLGIFYTGFTQYLGFPKYGDEYKVMGLAACGSPAFLPKVRDVVAMRGTSCRLNLDYFTHHSQGVDMTWSGGEPALGAVYSKKMIDQFGPCRAARSEVLECHADLAASVQAALEENYFALLNAVHKATGQTALCLAGGVALNCAANGKIFERTPFCDLYVQPAANDAGTSIGAALYVQHQVLKRPRSFVMRHVYYGPQYDAETIRRELDDSGVVYHKLEDHNLVARTAAELAAGKIVGWFQGRMEFGPRALGNRSILADPRRHDMKDILNRRIKYREPFRPFCPSVLAEEVGNYFDISYPSPFMIQAYRVRPTQRDRIPAVTHDDGTGRLQTVERDVNPLYWALIDRFRSLTGVPVLLNTSFNENEPIVNSPQQALDCFLRTRMDVLVIGPYLLLKAENQAHSKQAFAEIEADSPAPRSKSLAAGGSAANQVRRAVTESDFSRGAYGGTNHMRALITGSGGLIGSACASLLCEEGWEVLGVDNDGRREFFGPEASTRPVVESLLAAHPGYRHEDADIRDRTRVRDLVRTTRPNFIIHTAGQPSHDRAASIPYDDFDVNATGTLNLLVAVRDFCRESPVCFTSTNKVYGDRPNTIPLTEMKTRFEYADGRDGIDETMSVDQCLHSLFGASKLAADVICQEFGRYFDMPVGIFRAGCMTGPKHAAVELHGYLAYIVSAALGGREYTIHGYRGKQVRDQIHCRDTARLFLEFYRRPRCGEVYNLGGGRTNSLSIIETVERLTEMGYKLRYRYSDENRIGDHICYISDLRKIKTHFPNWKIEFDLDRILLEMTESRREPARKRAAAAMRPQL